MIELGHEGHQGLVKMKQRLRTKVWWPGIDKDAEKSCKTCHSCQVMSGLCNPEPLQMTEFPQGPWQDIAVDFMGPLSSGTMIKKSFLLFVPILKACSLNTQLAKF